MGIQHWVGALQVTEHKWTCGYCGLMVGGNIGYYPNSGGGGRSAPGRPVAPEMITAVNPRIIICPNCAKPTYFEGGKQVPGAAFGNEVAHLPPEVDGLYREARNCMSVSAYTASVLATRKLLMNVAVSRGAGPNQTFQNYVTFLATNGYVPPNASSWVDHIRTKGNEATHEIPPVGEADASDLLTFMEMILKLVFEFPSRVPKPGSAPASGS